ncbi:MAG: hypothetical protein ABIN91_16305 [Mucilaginibacter sp.]|uniref:hypothetical protein n=1 Tax=Mucilaginibacter sp. TaxID=1882438 RepID=UPI003262FC60
MKPPIWILLILILTTVCCKNQGEADPNPASLLTAKNWKPYYITPDKVTTGVASSSSFHPCEVNDTYNFNNNLLTITRDPIPCQAGSWYFGKNPASYIVDFTENKILIEGIPFYITKLTSDTLKVYAKTSYLAGMVNVPYIFIH